MNVLQLKNKNEFDDEIKKIVNMLKFDKTLPMIVGSSSLKSQQYFSDYDLFLKVSVDMSAEQVYKKLESILQNIFSNNDLFFTELKIQLINGKKYKYFYNDKFEFSDFEKKFNDNVDFIKLDFIARIKNIFTEISIIYKFGPAGSINIIQDLKEDIGDLKKARSYYKILKRFFSIFKQSRNEKMLKLLSEFFNSSYGAKYQIISNLEAIEKILSIYTDPDTKKKAKLNLSELKLGDVKSIDKLIKDFRKDINDAAKDYILRLKLKI